MSGNTTVMPIHRLTASENGAVERPAVPGWIMQVGLFDLVRDFLARDGKRIRAELIELSYRLAGGSAHVPGDLIEFIELLHAGSLIIDDIEDDSAVRRGQPALHRKFGVPLALNTGNWMYFSALEHLFTLPVDSSTAMQLFQQSVTTIRRCHEGQALDLAAQTGDLGPVQTLATVNRISRLKTGGLTSLAAQLGAAAAAADTACCHVLSRFGMELGVGLQMQNDLAELARCAQAGRPGDDLRNARVTWPWAWLGQVASGREFAELQSLSDPVASRDVGEIAIRLYDQVADHGHRQVRQQLSCAVAILEREFGNVASDKLRQIIQRLEPNHD